MIMMSMIMVIDDYGALWCLFHSMYTKNSFISHMIHCQVRHVGRKAFAEPQVRPPDDADQIPKPAVCNLVRHHLARVELLHGWGLVRVEQEDILPGNGG